VSRGLAVGKTQGAGETAQKEALTRTGHPRLTAWANLFRAYGAGSGGAQRIFLVFEPLPGTPSVKISAFRFVAMLRTNLGAKNG
jgi:hypothetical protein